MGLLTDRVKGNVTLVKYQAGVLWYRTDDGYSFKVAISETGTAAFLPIDKGIYFMRWIKAQMDEIQDQKEQYATT